MRSECAFDGCERVVYAKGLCHAHYGQERRGGELKPLRERGPGRPTVAQLCAALSDEALRAFVAEARIRGLAGDAPGPATPSRKPRSRELPRREPGPSREPDRKGRIETEAEFDARTMREAREREALDDAAREAHEERARREGAGVDPF